MNVKIASAAVLASTLLTGVAHDAQAGKFADGAKMVASSIRNAPSRLPKVVKLGIRVGASIGGAAAAQAMGGSPFEMGAASYGASFIAKKVMTPSYAYGLEKLAANGNSPAEKAVYNEAAKELGGLRDSFPSRVVKNTVVAAAGMAASGATAGLATEIGPVGAALVGMVPGSVAASLTSLAVNGKQYAKAVMLSIKGGVNLAKVKIDEQSK